MKVAAKWAAVEIGGGSRVRLPDAHWRRGTGGAPPRLPGGGRLRHDRGRDHAIGDAPPARDHGEGPGRRTAAVTPPKEPTPSTWNVTSAARKASSVWGDGRHALKTRFARGEGPGPEAGPCRSPGAPGRPAAVTVCVVTRGLFAGGVGGGRTVLTDQQEPLFSMRGGVSVCPHAVSAPHRGFPGPPGVPGAAARAAGGSGVARVREPPARTSGGA